MQNQVGRTANKHYCVERGFLLSWWLPSIGDANDVQIQSLINPSVIVWSNPIEKEIQFGGTTDDYWTSEEIDVWLEAFRFAQDIIRNGFHFTPDE